MVEGVRRMRRKQKWRWRVSEGIEEKGRKEGGSRKTEKTTEQDKKKRRRRKQKGRGVNVKVKKKKLEM